MYCSTCGAKKSGKEKQCSVCGKVANVKSHEQQVKPIAVLKPVLIIWLVIVRYLVVQINMTFVGGALGGVIIFVHHLFYAAPVVSWQPFFYSALFFFCAVPTVAIFIHKRTYDLTRYVFFSEDLEYYEGFWNVERKIINYQNITEVELKESFIQRLYHLGSIHVLVPSMNGKQSGILIADVKLPEKAYHFLQNVIREGARKS